MHHQLSESCTTPINYHIASLKSYLKEKYWLKEHAGLLCLQIHTSKKTCKYLFQGC